MDNPYKYVCYGGEVISADGDIHYITAHKMPELYKVNPQECVFIVTGRELRPFTASQLTNMIPLRPRSDGNYSELPQWPPKA